MDFISYGYFSFFTFAFSVITTLLNGWMCFVLFYLSLKRTGKNTTGLFFCLCGGACILTIVRFIHKMISYQSLLSFLLWLLFTALTVGGVYIIMHFLIGEDPFQSTTTDGPSANPAYGFSSRQTYGTPGKQSIQSSQDSPSPQRGAQQSSDAQASKPDTVYSSNHMPSPPNGCALFRLKTDRSLLMFIILGFITCGIYFLYFIYALARDLNIACEGDGRHTGGLLKYIFLGILTCGIYNLIWWYSVGNRLAVNAPRYNLSFPENGTTILLWMLFGVLICGIGPFIAWNIIIKNANMICGSYNHIHNM